MMTDFEVWAYRAVIAAALIVLWYFARQVLAQLKEMNVNIKSISDKGIIHDGKLEMVEKEVGDHGKRLDDHGKRIREVERKQDQCQICNEG